MSDEFDKRRPSGGWEQGGGEALWRPGRGKPGGSTPSSRLPASPWAQPPAAPVQRKATFVNPVVRAQERQEQQTREDAVFDFATPYIDASGADPVQRKQAGGATVASPIQRRKAVEPVAHSGHDLFAMATVLPMPMQSPVQRRVASESAPSIDAPRAASLSDDRATISASSEAATQPEAETTAAATNEAADGHLDASKEDSLGEDRATIEAEPAAAAGPLSPARATRAARKNPARVARHRIAPADLGTDEAPDTAAFAQAVAAFQQQHGLSVDGVVGPATAAAVRAGSANTPADGAPAADANAPEAIDSRGAGSSLLQMKEATAAPDSDADIHRAAAHGIAGSGQALPHLDRIQAAFGAHDISGIQAHVGGPAASASDAIGAEAYATGHHVAFKQSPDLHTAAHEAAHVVQQRAGVHLKGGVGQTGDTYEQHADAVADAVVRGDSAEALLGKPEDRGVQRLVQRKEDHEAIDLPGIDFSPASLAAADLKTQALMLFANRAAGVVAAQDEVRLTSEPVSGEQASILLQCALHAIRLVSGPIGGMIADAIYDQAMATGAKSKSKTWRDRRSSEPPTGPKSQIADTAIRATVVNVLSAGLAQIEASVAGEVETPASGAARPPGVGGMSERGQREHLGENAQSANMQIAFFTSQINAINSAHAALIPKLDLIIAYTVSKGSNDPSLAHSLRRLTTALQMMAGNATTDQANASMAQWMSFIAQARNGSQDTQERAAADLSGLNRFAPDGVLKLTITADVTNPRSVPTVVGAQYDGLEHKDALARVLSMDLLGLDVPVIVAEPQGNIVATRNEGGVVTCSDPMGFLQNKGKANRRELREAIESAHGSRTKAGNDAWAVEGARWLLERELLTRTLASHGIKEIKRT